MVVEANWGYPEIYNIGDNNKVTAAEANDHKNCVTPGGPDRILSFSCTMRTAVSIAVRKYISSSSTITKEEMYETIYNKIYKPYFDTMKDSFFKYETSSESQQEGFDSTCFMLSIESLTNDSSEIFENIGSDGSFKDKELNHIYIYIYIYYIYRTRFRYSSTRMWDI